MGNPSRRHTPEFKKFVVLEVLRGERTQKRIAARYGVHPSQVSEWKRQALDGLSESFVRDAKGRRRREEAKPRRQLPRERRYPIQGPYSLETELDAARLMEQLWQVRRELGDDVLFGAFVQEYVRVLKPLEPSEALLMAEAWELARERPELRRILAALPGEVVGLIKAALALDLDLRGLTDEQLSSVFARAPRLRKGVLKKLKASVSRSDSSVGGERFKPVRVEKR